MTISRRSHRVGRIAALLGLLAAAGCATPSPTHPTLRDVTWLAQDVAGGGVVDRLQSTVRFGSDGKLSGNGGCNEMSGVYDATTGTLRVGPIGATKKLCPPAAMDQETKFFAALEGARTYTFNRDGSLVIAGAGGTLRLVAHQR